MTKLVEDTAGKGRPREFDCDAALANAMQVFWSKSYTGASLTDLTEAMGITRPSLYAAFGNKDALFKQAFDLYGADRLAYAFAALEAPTAREVVKQLLAGTIDNVTSENRGCLWVTALVSCTEASSSIQQDIQAGEFGSENPPFSIHIAIVFNIMAIAMHNRIAGHIFLCPDG